jgi:hypothetical protein
MTPPLLYAVYRYSIAVAVSYATIITPFDVHRIICYIRREITTGESMAALSGYHGRQAAMPQMILLEPERAVLTPC